MLGAVKENLEQEEAHDELKPRGLAQFSATCWTVRPTCFKRIFQNYEALMETWKECLIQGGFSADVKARVIGCQAKMKTFDYFFGLLL